MMEEHVEQVVVAVEIPVAGGDDIPHGEALLFKDLLFQHGQGIRNGRDADALDIARIVAGATGIVVLAAGDAVVGDDRQQWYGHVLHIEPFNEVVSGDFDVDDVFQFFQESLPYIVIRCKLQRVADVDARLFPGIGIVTAVQGQFQDLGDVEITRQDIGFLAGCPGFDAAAGNAAGPGVVQGFP